MGFRILMTLFAGVLLYLSFAPRDLWWLTPFAFMLFASVIRHRRARAGFGYGLLFGLAFLLPLLWWLESFLASDLGPLPWLALSGALACYVALSAAAMATVSKLPGAPVWMAALFIAGEAFRSRFPFGGFPWARIGFSQPDGPFLPIAALGGVPLLGFAVICTGCALAELSARLGRAGSLHDKKLITPLVMALIPLLIGLSTTPVVSTEAQNGTRTIAVIQGDAPDDGLNLASQTPVLRANTIAETEHLADQIHTHQVPKPDLVIWPETATDLIGNPAQDTELAAVIAGLGIPVLVGGRLFTASGNTQNVVIAWDPASGPVASYAKQQLVPFGEFIPLRPIASLVSPFIADNNGKDMVPGTTPGALPIANTTVGIAICYEVAYDSILRDAVRDGAQILAIPTNNAWYGHTDMSYQQLAMARVRAVELGRAIAVSATSGVSALVQPDGSVTAQSTLFTATSLVATMPLRSTTTLATLLGAWLEWVIVGAGLIALLVVIVSSRRPARTSSAT